MAMADIEAPGGGARAPRGGAKSYGFPSPHCLLLSLFLLCLLQVGGFLGMMAVYESRPNYFRYRQSSFGRIERYERLHNYSACFNQPRTTPDPLWGDATCLLEVDRFIPHIATDKPVYRPGETLYVSVVSTHAHNERTFFDDSDANYYGRMPTPALKVLSPKGEEVATIIAESESNYGFLAFSSWALPQYLPGGEYTLKASFDDDWPNASAERKFQVRAFRNPKLRVTVAFIGEGYGPGDEVRARVGVVRGSDDGAAGWGGTRVTLTARVDGNVVHGPSEAKLDGAGECLVTFRLPHDMAEGQGVLTAVVDDGGLVESGSKTIPIVIHKLNVRMYPEGGPLVRGVRNSVYFEALTLTDEPVDLVGQVWAVGGRRAAVKVADVATLHEGRGRFEVAVPGKDDGTRFELRVTKPAGVTAPIPLPEAEAPGPSGGPLVAIRAKKGSVFQGRGAEVRVWLSASKPGRALVTLHKRERAVGTARPVEVKFSRAGEEVEVSLGEVGAVCGVLRLTVHSVSETGGEKRTMEAVAERLLFRRPEESLSVEVKVPMGDSASPGAEQTVEIRVRGSSGEPVEDAIVSVVVTDVSTLGLVEDRRKPPRLPEMVYLEGEVAHLEDSGVYLQPGAKGEEALDLLLGTQGWRRFLYADPLAVLRRADKDAQGEDTLEGSTGAVTEEDGSRQKSREKAERAMGIHIPPKDAFRLYQGAEMTTAEAEMAAMGSLDVLHGDGDMAEGTERMMDTSIFPLSETSSKFPLAAEEFGEGDIALPGVEDFAAQDPGRGQIDLPFEDAGSVGEAAALPSRFGQQELVGTEWDQHQVREYAYKRKTSQKEWEAGEQTRSDFTETVYWSAGTKTDIFGVVTARFHLSDAITSFVVMVDAHANVWDEQPYVLDGSGYYFRDYKQKKGVFGVSKDVFIVSKKPLSVDAKLPLQVTAGDRVFLPVLLSSATGAADVAVNVSCTSELAIVGSKNRESPVATPAGSSEAARLRFTGDGRKRHIVAMDVRGVRPKPPSPSAERLEARESRFGSASVEVRASSVSRAWRGGKPFHDAVLRTLTVAPSGFPFVRSAGGVLRLGEGAAVANFSGKVPSDSDALSLSVSVTAYPSPVANIAKALEALVQEPRGCFEQASATIYPNIMVQQYLQAHGDVEVSGLLARSYEMLEKGFSLLARYEVDRSGGYEWFGAAPAHEALTAYALLEFLDLATVFPVPQEMISRTKKWLLGRKDDVARGFKIDPRQLGSFGGTPVHISDAYIIWALTCAKLTEGLEAQIERLHEVAKESKDPYHIALAAGSLYNVGRTTEARQLAQSLRKHQRLDGAILDAQTSITSSGGASLVVETTALSILAWVADSGDEFAPDVRRAIEWLAASCQDGMYGSTQATVLSLKALLAYDAKRMKQSQAVVLHLSVNGERVESVTHDGKSVGAVSFSDIGSRLLPGAPYAIHLAMESSQVDGPGRALTEDLVEAFEMPYSIQMRYHAPRPPRGSQECAVSIQVALPKTRAIMEGDVTEVSVTLLNTQNKTQPMTLAIVGLPGGLEPRHEQLKDLVTTGAVSFYEVRGQEVVLYWRFLGPSEKKAVKLEAVASVPGTYTGIASRAYLYYTDECKSWADPLKCKIKSRD